MNDVVPIYKPEGISPFTLINQFKKEFHHYAQEKISAAGRLDPMASGLLLLLVGDANKNRSYFQSIDKTYIFTLLIGVTTDTYDILGKVTSIVSSPTRYSPQELLTVMKEFRGTFLQSYPPYSSMHVLGKPLFYWARENKIENITIPTKEITVKSLELVSSYTLTKTKFIQDIEKRLGRVQGDFRQNEIKEIWENSLSSLPHQLQLFTLEANVSSGTYIRSLCFELGRLTGKGGLAYTIQRTGCGDYTLENAVHLNEQ